MSKDVGTLFDDSDTSCEMCEKCKTYEPKILSGKQVNTPMSTEVSLHASSAVKLLKILGASHDYILKEHSYKFSLTDYPCLSTTSQIQEEAAGKMIIEIQKHINNLYG